MEVVNLEFEEKNAFFESKYNKMLFPRSCNRSDLNQTIDFALVRVREDIWGRDLNAEKELGQALLKTWNQRDYRKDLLFYSSINNSPYSLNLFNPKTPWQIKVLTSLPQIVQGLCLCNFKKIFNIIFHDDYKYLNT